MKIAVLSPHRDDAAFSLGLAIDRWSAAGHAVHVLNCFTQSEYAPYSDADSLHPNDRRSFVSAIRKREDAAWNKLSRGKLQITDLDLLDAPLRLVCGLDEVLTIGIRPGDRALARVAGAIAKLAKGGAAIALPLAIGGHIDHRVVREAGLQALQGLTLPMAFYEDLPYAARPGAAEDIEPFAMATGLGLRPGIPQMETQDIAAQAKRKGKLAECYDSQIDSGVAAQIAGFCERYGGGERLWVNEAWQASPYAVRHSELPA